jgi:hypothetical protein
MPLPFGGIRYDSPLSSTALPPPPGSGNSTALRIYDLRYPDHGMRSSTTVRVSCSGGWSGADGKRVCYTTTGYRAPYRYHETLGVNYVMVRAYSSAEDPMAEAERVLALDRRVRARIDSMMSPQ